MSGGQESEAGFTLVELLVAITIAGILFASLGGVVFTAMQAETEADERRDLSRQASFAMARMLDALRRGGPLVLPRADDPATPQDESVRDILSVGLDPTRDLDGDGVPDADNDGDGRIDEDWPRDANNDFAQGIYQLDDDGDGSTDEWVGFDSSSDDDEDGSLDEDPVNGIDDDGDVNVDEDRAADMNGDGAPGIAGFDDDGDGSVDEGVAGDDDEDGSSDEDWLDTVSFFRTGGLLVERIPVPWDETGMFGVTGRDFVEATIAAGVTDLQITRIGSTGSGHVLVEVSIELTGASGRVVALTSQVRVGAQP